MTNVHVFKLFQILESPIRNCPKFVVVQKSKKKEKMQNGNTLVEGKFNNDVSL